MTVSVTRSVTSHSVTECECDSDCECESVADQSTVSITN